MRRLLLGVVLLGLAPALHAQPILVWTLERGVVRGPATQDRPEPIGSLLKPFVAKAWALAHPGAAPPAVVCDRASGCWRPSGHGELGLVRALAVSCNTYFKRLAAQTPAETVAATLRGEGFVVPAETTPDTAIGLGADDAAVAASPQVLLGAYARLATVPWAVAEETRQAVLAGLRDSASVGTARGLGRRGFWAKTGTVAALDGSPLATSGWVVAVDDSGWAVLGLLERGTGRQAALALAEPLDRLRPWSASRAAIPPPPAHGGSPAARASAEPRVRVGLLDALGPAAVTARNLGPAPAPSSRGFVGPQASFPLRAGDHLDEALWELALPGLGFTRRVRGAVRVLEGPGGSVRLRAELRPEEYVAGVIAAELPAAGRDLRVALGAAVLRFLAGGPRHGSYDVCDQTHCAWFVGRGPRVVWVSPRVPVLLASARGQESDALEPHEWARMQAEAHQNGPRLFTGHCGGHPLSAHFVWGNGDHRVWRCERHATGPATAWARSWTQEAVDRAFGTSVERLFVTTEDGIWTLQVGAPRGPLAFRYDEAHRRLATVLGWDALPSPADRVERTATGFRALGVGSGHRVGLCLGE